jgi:hypothetical protein
VNLLVSYVANATLSSPFLKPSLMSKSASKMMIEDLDTKQPRRTLAKMVPISLAARFVHPECRAAHDRDSGHQLRRPSRHTVTTPLSREP